MFGRKPCPHGPSLAAGIPSDSALMVALSRSGWAPDHMDSSRPLQSRPSYRWTLEAVTRIDTLHVDLAVIHSARERGLDNYRGYNGTSAAS